MAPRFSAEMVNWRLHPMSLAQDLGVIELLFSQNMLYSHKESQLVAFGVDSVENKKKKALRGKWQELLVFHHAFNIIAGVWMFMVLSYI
jgi:hypothetical protein